MSFNPFRVLGWALGFTVVGSRRLANLEGQVEAVSKSQAVIEFNMDGTIRRNRLPNQPARAQCGR
jgi:methyl-accepting chemotaxis protein